MNNQVYADRILLRAQNQRMFDYGAFHFSDLDDDVKEEILSQVDTLYDPLLVLWSSKEKWTVITADKIYSLHGGELYNCMLDDIKDDIEGMTPDGDLHGGHSLRTSEVLFLRRPMIGVWAPAGELFHGLWHVLKYCR